MDRNEGLKQVGESLVALLVGEAQQVGEAIVEDLDAVATYAAERAEHLATVVGEPGFEQALQAERDNIAIRAALRTVESADNLDERILRVTSTGLQMAATALRVVL